MYDYTDLRIQYKLSRMLLCVSNNASRATILSWNFLLLMFIVVIYVILESKLNLYWYEALLDTQLLSLLLQLLSKFYRIFRLP